MHIDQVPVWFPLSASEWMSLSVRMREVLLDVVAKTERLEGAQREAEARRVKKRGVGAPPDRGKADEKKV